MPKQLPKFNPLQSIYSYNGHKNDTLLKKLGRFITGAVEGALPLLSLHYILSFYTQLPSFSQPNLYMLAGAASLSVMDAVLSVLKPQWRSDLSKTFNAKITRRLILLSNTKGAGIARIVFKFIYGCAEGASIPFAIKTLPLFVLATPSITIPFYLYLGAAALFGLADGFYRAYKTHTQNKLEETLKKDCSKERLKYHLVVAEAARKLKSALKTVELTNSMMRTNKARTKFSTAKAIKHEEQVSSSLALELKSRKKISDTHIKEALNRELESSGYMKKADSNGFLHILKHSGAGFAGGFSIAMAVMGAIDVTAYALWQLLSATFAIGIFSLFTHNIIDKRQNQRVAEYKAEMNNINMKGKLISHRMTSLNTLEELFKEDIRMLSDPAVSDKLIDEVMKGLDKNTDSTTEILQQLIPEATHIPKEPLSAADLDIKLPKAPPLKQEISILQELLSSNNAPSPLRSGKSRKKVKLVENIKSGLSSWAAKFKLKKTKNQSSPRNAVNNTAVSSMLRF